jgi:ABC-type transport system substrate-binding protein
MPQHTVFVSHAHIDNALCDPVVDALRGRGVDVWYDGSNLQAGHLLSDGIQTELETRSALLLMLTPASIASYWVQSELNAFRDLVSRDRARVIVPVRLAPCEAPELLQGHLWIDALDVPMETVLDQLAPALGFPTQAELAAVVAAKERRLAAEERRAERERVARGALRAQRRARLRADLAAVAGLTLGLLALVGLVLPLIFPFLPRAVMVGAVVVAALLLLGWGAVRPVRRLLTHEWHDARQGLSAVLSVLLTLTVVFTILFLTKPTLVATTASRFEAYNFTYAPRLPIREGGSVTVGLWRSPVTSNPLVATRFGSDPDFNITAALWDSCLVQLPDVGLGIDGFRPDLCTTVPTVENGDQAPDNAWTILRIDPQAVWSDGVPITADDFLFFYRMVTDPAIIGGPPFSLMKAVTKVDADTIKITWSHAIPLDLSALALWTPMPLHIYNARKYAGVYDPATGSYNSALAQQLFYEPVFAVTPLVDSGAFIEVSFAPDQVVLVRNAHFHSNFFTGPFLDSVTFKAYGDPTMPSDARRTLLIQGFKRGEVDLAADFEPIDNAAFQAQGISRSAVIASPQFGLVTAQFNLRSTAPNAQANGGTSIFADPTVRRAFFEAFDRCGALHALSIGDCSDPNLRTDEFSLPPAFDYDPRVRQPAYNPADAARLMDRAGYPVVDGVRRQKDGRTPLNLTLATLDPTTFCEECAPIAERMQHDYQANLHIAVTVSTSGPDIFYAPFTEGGTLATGAFDLTTSFMGFPRSDPIPRVAQLTSQEIPSAQHPFGANIGGVSDATIDAEARSGLHLLDFAQRRDLYQGLIRYIASLNVIESVYIADDVTLTRHTVGNYLQAPVSSLIAWNAADWYSCSENAGTQSACR